ncbi:Na+/H+ antiporter NhaA [Parasphingorhabdus sp. JC815]|uniref:Na+/H+ antiporter NhaA n=1 Tax=Parasphingorhabdus sp. JC815 TaxID=3232140 RepID=UPI0034575BA3
MSSEKLARSGSISALRNFLRSEASGGILLMVAAALAMIVANSPLYDMYHHFLHEIKGPVISEKLGPMTPHLWINDGLMAIFFMLVGLEIKREFVDGRLNSWDRRRLPVLAAAAGMVVPALIYLAVVRDMPALYNGWAIPAATDIAFAIGVLALLGPRAPTSLKLFLVTVAIVDDMGAVAIIALVYTAEINGAALLASAVILGIMYTLNKANVRSLLVYLFFAVLLWFAVLMSGVHATIAGVLAAMAIPIIVTPGAPDSQVSPLHRLEHAIAPWSAFFIVPLFGFANAGVSLDGIGLEHIFAPLPIGIALGLFLGKQVGIFAAVWIAVKTGFAERMGGASWLQVYGVSMLCGIGFTMSLFIGALAFPGNMLLIEEAKIGVLGGSFLSAIVGYCILRFAPQNTHLAALDEKEEQELKAVL